MSPPLLGNGSPTMRSMFPPLVGSGSPSSERCELSSVAREWSPTMRSMFPPLVGKGHLAIMEGVMVRDAIKEMDRSMS